MGGLEVVYGMERLGKPFGSQQLHQYLVSALPGDPCDGGRCCQKEEQVALSVSAEGLPQICFQRLGVFLPALDQRFFVLLRQQQANEQGEGGVEAFLPLGDLILIEPG